MSSSRGLPRFALLSRDRGSRLSSDRIIGLEDRSGLDGMAEFSDQPCHGYAGGRGDEVAHTLEQEAKSDMSLGSDVSGVSGAADGAGKIVMMRCGVTGHEDDGRITVCVFWLPADTMCPIL